PAMTAGDDSSRARIAELEARVERLQARLQLDREVDELLERAIREHLSLEQTLERIYPLIARRIGLRAALVRTYDEGLAMRDFFLGEPTAAEALGESVDVLCVGGDDEATRVVRESAGGTIIAQELDVAGEHFGAAAVLLRSDQDVEQAQVLLEVACEELDNHLAAIARARLKHRVTSELSAALKEPVLDDGIDRAVAVLAAHVPFSTLLLVYRHEDDAAGVTLNLKVYDGKRATPTRDDPSKSSPAIASTLAQDIEIDDFLRSKALDMVAGRDDALAHHFGIQRYREEVLINGVRDERIIGRVVLTRGGELHRGSELNTFDRDLLERFSDYLRQRIVDFNHEYKSLSLCFDPCTVRQLLSDSGYRRRYLDPRLGDVAIMYCDISGFTRLSEQVLREPVAIGRLVDLWSAHAVQLIWQTGGVFDKMVGDCVIALWGPPLYPFAPREACRRALQTARAIRDFTRTLHEHEALPELHGLEEPAGVATGLNFCPLFVGRFGPNEDYTGFSSGMNNAARLQGLAVRDEILCMESFVEMLDDAEQFGERRAAPVKNVERPLAFRAAH
ncbi:MAG: adenylate/guanylate cyclase domain-containing protein, partial [Myxococcales bacterium]|nr:adenylate/guanylate cyclase domain-containing protein [Myxococcales bacterium]